PKMTTNLPRIDYYFDVISPYSYIGFETLQQLQHQWNGVEIRYIPFALANEQPPGALSVRWDMMMIDLKRSAKFLDIPLTPNPFFMKWIR
uniref:DSBA domain-containing protein n=1 Tax=Caenorhabditis japonica TaxID=281687 RepID=A0A8R1EIX6_CAEJA